MYACSAVHSALDVGLLRAKMIGRLLLAAIVWMISGVKAPATAAAPVILVEVSLLFNCLLPMVYKMYVISQFYYTTQYTRDADLLPVRWEF